MSETTTAEKKTRLDKLTARKAEIEAALKAEKDRLAKQQRKAKTAENAKLRKEQNQLKYAFGGLCEIAGLTKLDKGAVLGALLWVNEVVLKDADKFAGYKNRGDSILARREAGRKARKAGEA